jgi:hypothetical protein
MQQPWAQNELKAQAIQQAKNSTNNLGLSMKVPGVKLNEIKQTQANARKGSVSNCFWGQGPITQALCGFVINL